nr:immunoglobulin light chain junction region [Macaca mulatta]
DYYCAIGHSSGMFF